MEVNIHSLDKNKVYIEYMLLNVSFGFPKCITPLEANRIRVKLEDNALLLLEKILNSLLPAVCKGIFIDVKP